MDNERAATVNIVVDGHWLCIIALNAWCQSIFTGKGVGQWRSRSSEGGVYGGPVWGSPPKVYVEILHATVHFGAFWSRLSNFVGAKRYSRPGIFYRGNGRSPTSSISRDRRLRLCLRVPFFFSFRPLFWKGRVTRNLMRTDTVSLINVQLLQFLRF